MIHSEVRLWAIVSQPMATNMTIRSCPMSNPKPAIQRYATKTTNLDCRNRRSMTDRISMSSIILSDEYADARNLNEAIDMRGQKAFAQSVTPDDFRDASPDNMTNWVLPNCGSNRGGMMADPRAISRWSSSLPTFTRETCWKSVVVPRKSALGDTRSIVWMTISCCHPPPTMISTTGSFLECWTTCPKTDG